MLKCMEYIDFFLAGCDDVIKLDDKLDEEERQYFEISAELLQRGSTPALNLLTPLEERLVVLCRDVTVIKCLLYKLVDVAIDFKSLHSGNGRPRGNTSDTGSTKSGMSTSIIYSLIGRVSELEGKIETQAETINETHRKRLEQPFLNLRQGTLEKFSSLQVQPQKTVEDFESVMDDV